MKTKLGRLRLLAFFEGLSFLLILFVTMPLKYWADMPGPNKYIGMAHGLLFILYVYYVFVTAPDYRWSLGTIFWALLASVVPFGTFVADARIFKKEIL